jgi:hypothetical protein
MERLRDIPGWIFFSISFHIHIATNGDKKEMRENLKVISLIFFFFNAERLHIRYNSLW